MQEENRRLHNQTYGELLRVHSVIDDHAKALAELRERVERLEAGR